MPCPAEFGFCLYPFCSLQRNTSGFDFKNCSNAERKGKGEGVEGSAQEHTLGVTPVPIWVLITTLSLAFFLSKVI